MQELLHSLGDLEGLIRSVGYIGVFAIIFAESGLLIGFFLPGDSLLFTAGFLASQGFFSLPILAVGCFVCAVAGDSVGYWFGHRVGRRLFQREDSLLFKKKHLYSAQALYEKHGGKIIFLARFMPIVRTFAPFVAGIGHMRYSRFLSYSLAGGLLWTGGLIAAGYFFGNLPAVRQNFGLVVIAIIVVSVLPAVVEFLKTRSRMKQQ
jgi:membrane-associated protein